MRRIGAAAVALFVAGVFVVSSHGQSIIDTSTASKFYIGVKGGVVLSTFWGPDRPRESATSSAVQDLAYSLLPGASAGVNIPIVFSDLFTLEPEVLITTTGATWVDTAEDLAQQVDKDIMRRFIDISIPVLAKLTFLGPERRFRPVVYLGPQLTIHAGSYTKKTGSGDMSTSQNSYALYDSTIAVDAGLIGGLGVHIRAGKGYFIIDARANVGFVNSGNGTDGEYPKTIRNMYAIGSVAYCFNPKRRKSLW